MKIYLLPVSQHFLPSAQPFQYPRHNKDYGVEQDFFNFLKRNPSLLVDNPAAADWHYLPVFWTRWHLNHDYARSGLEELQQEVNSVMLRDDKTVTICQYDGGPIVNLGRTKQFLASREDESGLDIPLLSEPHRVPLFRPRRKYLASFVGRLATHPTRLRMADAVRSRDDVLLVDGDHGPRFFVRACLASDLVLAPRGSGGSSFRFFEAMQLGVPPILLGDLDTRPFKSQIDWSSCSFYLNDPTRLPFLLEQMETEELANMGHICSRIYREQLAYGKWGKFLVKELESL